MEYVHIQFSLLREDFMGPLRDDLRKFRKTYSRNDGKRFSDIRVYDNVKLVSMVCDNGLNYVLTFDVSKLRNVRWNSCDRLIYGRLVCLSHDNFSTMLVGVVQNSDKREKGKIHVEFNDDVDNRTIKANMSYVYTLIEPTAYFEPYKHVLQKLKTMHEPDLLSMARYILYCEKDVMPPKYLRDEDNPNPLVDLNTLCKAGVKVEIWNQLVSFQEHVYTTDIDNKPSHPRRRASIDLKKEKHLIRYLKTDSEAINENTCLADTETGDDVSEGSSPEELEEPDLPKINILVNQWLFDESQVKAIRNALTKEISIIQGPPGCGKTYIGLQIVKVLLQNIFLWKRNHLDGPILVMCYTNHALDQFVEGIMESFSGGILRVGGRSKSDKLQPCNLANIKREMRNRKAIPDYIYKGQKASKGKLYQLKKKRYVTTKQILILKDNIVHENALFDEMGSDIFKQFQWRSNVTNPRITSKIHEWLGIEDLNREVKYTIRCTGLHNFIEADIKSQQHEERDEFAEMDLRGHFFTRGEDDIKFKDDKETKKLLKEFVTKHVALNISQLCDKPEDVNNEEWDLLRWQRFELVKRLRDKLQKAKQRTVVIPKGTNVYEFTIDDRWRIYAQWVDQKCQKLEKEIEEDVDDFKSTYEKHKEIQMLENRHIMKMADVIGMTTTGAAKHRLELQEVNAKIVIVEEAAEVLESHLVSNIYQGCEQLILIGDHQQLRPKPNNFKLEKKYNLGVSLFERLILSGMDYTTLDQQHRMSPIIASNIRHIYPNVVDHEDVKQYGDVAGMQHNMVFFNHTRFEESNGETSSKKNHFEATFSISLAKYLIQQGYSSDRLTILTTYKGQMFEIMSLKRREPFLNGVKVTVVDNFQGEENDIIILSLVRSNIERSIGFLSNDNRVCVALSRAKYGLYVLGNISMYDTSLWRKILTSPTTKHRVMPAIPLKCQNHPDSDPTLVAQVADFAMVPGGGCSLPCQFALTCGHICPKQCHLLDKEHHHVVCRMPCERVCKNNHQCILACGETCRCEIEMTEILQCGHSVVYKCHEEVVCLEKCEKKLECGHVCAKMCAEECSSCITLVERVLQRCGHVAQLPCHKDIMEYTCQQPCDSVMECGHKCRRKCGDSHPSDCFSMFRKSESTCTQGHTSKCCVPCSATLACGHACTGTCSECFHGTIHRPCSKKCAHLLICGHACSGNCNNCVPCRNDCNRWCKHKYCSEICSEICVKCQEPCAWACPHHTCPNDCSEPCDRLRCYRRCKEKLICEHDCIGLCGEPCPPYCQYCEGKKSVEFFANCFGSQIRPESSFVLLEDCGHAVEYKFLDLYFDQEESDELLLKQCPVCRSPIYNCRRYGNVLHALHDRIDSMKMKLFEGQGSRTIWYRSSEIEHFEDKLSKLNERNVDTLHNHIIEYTEKFRNKCESRRLIPNNLSMPTKQWIQDCENEIYRKCDYVAVSSLSLDALETDQEMKLKDDVLENLTSVSRYTTELRQQTIGLVRCVNSKPGTHLKLTNLAFEVTKEDDRCWESPIYSMFNPLQDQDAKSVIIDGELPEIDETTPYNSDNRNEKGEKACSENETVDVATPVLELPRKLTLYELQCQEYFKCRKAPFPIEFQTILSDKPGKKRKHSDDRNDDRGNKQTQRGENKPGKKRKHSDDRNDDRGNKQTQRGESSKRENYSRLTGSKTDTESIKQKDSRVTKKANSGFSYKPILFGEETNANQNRERCQKTKQKSEVKVRGLNPVGIKGLWSTR